VAGGSAGQDGYTTVPFNLVPVSTCYTPIDGLKSLTDVLRGHLSAQDSRLRPHMLLSMPGTYSGSWDAELLHPATMPQAGSQSLTGASVRIPAPIAQRAVHFPIINNRIPMLLLVRLLGSAI